ncbi:MAG: DUF1499 domain-containing protein [Asticcacaulis sp.]
MAEISEGRRILARRMALFALLFSLTAPLLIFFAAVLTKMDVIDAQVGFDLLTVSVSPKLAILGLASSILILLLTLFLCPTRAGWVALGAAVLSGFTVGGFALYQSLLLASPPVSDVATRWAPALSYSRESLAMRRRGDIQPEEAPFVPRTAPLQWSGRSVADINAETCPGLTSVTGMKNHHKVAEVLQAEKWTVTGRSPWRVEGRYETFWFGLSSDVVIEMRNGRTDLRITSVEAVPDLGRNCRLARSLLAELRKLP